MASPAKWSKAIKAMESLGFLGKTVNPILQDLLLIKSNTWKVIEKEGYLMLVDAILQHSEQERKENGKERESTMRTKLESQIARSPAGASATLMVYEATPSGVENSVQDKDLINDVCTYPGANFPLPLAEILQENDCCSNCSIDCLSSATICPCANKSGGDFAYSTGGVVDHGFIDKCISQQKVSFCLVCPLERSKKTLTSQCKGHAIRKFIKECWHKCGCHSSCAYRTVQRGITVKLQVFMTPGGKGWGLRTLDDLPKGAFICEYIGEILTTMELAERKMKNMDMQYTVILDAGWGSGSRLKDEDSLCLDGASYGNIARFINHRCNDANMIEIPVEMETPYHHYYHVAFFTTREVKAMEELTWDYGINFGDDSQQRKVFRCCCGSNFCRDRKGSVQNSLVPYSGMEATSLVI